jgi:hypothetical protein
MDQWLFDLPVIWLAGAIFITTGLVAYAIHATIGYLAAGPNTKIYKGISPGMLPPLGVVFGLFVAFVASQVWSDMEKATTAVNREASALSTVVFLSAGFPGRPEADLRSFIQQHIQQAATQEWPMMAAQAATLNITPTALAGAMKLALSLTPNSPGQQTAQREITNALEAAMDARRQRIIVSRSHVNGVKWAGLIVQAICTLFAIAMVHCDNRKTSAIATGIFGTGVAVAILLIASHDRPFGGRMAVGPAPLLQVLPEAAASRQEFDHSIALQLAGVLRSARAVISNQQDKINEPSSNKSSLTADKIIEAVKADYAKTIGQPIPTLDPSSLEGGLLQAELQAIREVIDQAQPMLNDPNRGFKGFIPAGFARQVVESFNSKVGNLAYLRLTAPSEVIRNPSNRPDTWEDRMIKSKLQSIGWEMGRFVADEADLGGRRAYRLLIPEYYDTSCLACHGEPKGEMDITNGRKEGGKLGDLGGAVSVGIYLP